MNPTRFLCATPRYCFYTDPSINGSHGENGIRTHVPRRTSGFQDRLVMATSISLQILAHRITRNFPTGSAYPDGRVPDPFSENPSEASFSCVSDHAVVGRKPDFLRISCRKSQRSDSNRQPADYKSAALPIGLRGLTTHTVSIQTRP